MVVETFVPCVGVGCEKINEWSMIDNRYSYSLDDIPPCKSRGRPEFWHNRLCLGTGMDIMLKMNIIGSTSFSRISIVSIQNTTNKLEFTLRTTKQAQVPPPC